VGDHQISFVDVNGDLQALSFKTHLTVTPLSVVPDLAKDACAAQSHTRS
jgi:hypothetical protein